MKITVSPTVPEELDGICAINASSDPWTKSSSSKSSRFFSAHGEGGVLIGYALISVLFEDAEILSVAVDDSFRRCGVGRALMHAMLTEAVRSGAQDIFLEVRESNHAARKLYLSEGFTEFGRRKRYYRKPTEDAILMRLSADSAMLG
ncbi:MAG: ribosomal protein S18-alanine N-acetyltransferase [Lachnospiraceae bacterium]